MLRLIEEDRGKFCLSDYAADTKFAASVVELTALAKVIVPQMRGRTLWMVNSTAQGGGVAEMLPTMLGLMKDLGLSVRWAVIGSRDAEFFRITKRIHNLIHGDRKTGDGLGPDAARIYERVNEENAAALRPLLKSEDILIVHDPQPLPLGQILRRELGLLAIWRCHIGLDRRTDETIRAWEFLRPYFDGYAHAVFSAPEYIPSYLGGRASIIPPAIDPLSYKNRDLAVARVVGILCNSGLERVSEPIPTPNYTHRVQQMSARGSLRPPKDLGLLHRPIVLQISRWDRLKGWLPLLEGFVRMKRDFDGGKPSDLSERNRRRLKLSRLVLAGPDPASIGDDPEGKEVLNELRDRYRRLGARFQRDIAILLLPMASRKENALIVNALQRCATIAVQNSLEEGFGLTVSEAMWKQLPVLGTRACGIRQQIRDGIDGLLTRQPEDPAEIARNLRDMLTRPHERFLWARSAQRRVYDHFLVFRQIMGYLELLRHLIHVQDTLPRLTVPERIDP